MIHSPPTRCFEVTFYGGLLVLGKKIFTTLAQAEAPNGFYFILWLSWVHGDVLCLPGHGFASLATVADANTNLSVWISEGEDALRS